MEGGGGGGGKLIAGCRLLAVWLPGRLLLFQHGEDAAEGERAASGVLRIRRLIPDPPQAPFIISSYEGPELLKTGQKHCVCHVTLK